MDFTLLECVPDAIVIVDHGGEIVYVNGITEALFGYTRAELIGRSVEDLLPTRFRDLHRLHRGGYEGAPRVRPMGLGLELSGVKRSGEEFSADISLAPMEVGGERYVLAAIRDTTERKKIEERARIWREAQDEIRRRDEFLSVAAHELRTPVTALQLQARLLQRALQRQSADASAVIPRKVKILERQTRRIAQLVSALLDVSSVHLGRLQLHLELVNLAELVSNAVDDFRDELEGSGSEIVVRTETDVTGRWDRLRMDQVVTNLITNAVKFGEGKPVVVSVGAADPERARISVEDHGTGIPPEDQARVFERFERAVPAESYPGMGLGLYVAKEIVQAHGGTISFRSRPGAGTTFTVELPRTS